MGRTTDTASAFCRHVLVEYSSRFCFDYQSWFPNELGILLTGIFIGYFAKGMFPASSTKKKKNETLRGAGKIFYDVHDLLDAGSLGSKIYNGKFETIDVAVKVIQLKSSNDAKLIYDSFSNDETANSLQQSNTLNTKRIMREVNINQAITLKNDFIVQYHGQEFFQMNKTAYVLIALELCNANLQQVVEQWNDYAPSSPRQIMEDLGKGLDFLHQEGIVHRDLKPSNILAKKTTVGWRFKIADFGQSKTAHFGRYELKFSISESFGSDGSKAPEVEHLVRNRSIGTSAEDIFSMGLIYYFADTLGKRLYASQEHIQSNTLNTDMESNIKETPVWDIIQKMTYPDPKRRISTSEVLKHPALWDSEKVISFYIGVNKVLDKTTLPDLEKQHSCFSGNWIAALTPAVEKSIRKGKYDFTLVKHLIRMIRNAEAHSNTFKESVKKEYGKTPDSFLKYWAERFPSLLLHTYNVIGKHEAAKVQLSQFY